MRSHCPAIRILYARTHSSSHGVRRESGRTRGLGRRSDRHGHRSAAQLRVAVDRSRLQDRPARVRRHHHRLRPALFREHADQRRAAALAVPHDPLAAPARREDGAVLAQPLRDRLQQDRRRRRPGARHADDGQRSEQPRRQRARADPDAAPARDRQLPDDADGDGERPGDDLLARQPAEHADAAAGKFRPRDHGAVQPRRRQLHRAGRLRRGPRVHRLQLADRRRPRQQRPPATTRSCTGRTITTPTRKSSPSRSIRTAAASFPRAPRRPANRTRST